MRLWSLHPQFLDRVGIASCWSEGLGGLRALKGLQKMHLNHPQLERFKAHSDPVMVLGSYLRVLYGQQRANLNVAKLFALCKLFGNIGYREIPVTSGQIAYEQWFLWTKLRCRDLAAAGRLMVPTDELKLHPLFYRVTGPVEAWERVK